MDQSYLTRRYLVSFEARRTPHIFTDVLVIGAGAAGLSAAIEASNHGSVIMIVKGELGENNSAYAQGGVAAVMDDADTPADHVADTLFAGAGLCNEKAVWQIIENSKAQIDKLLECGTDFDRDEGELALTREGGHGRRRIVHAHGDATGREIVRALDEKAKNCDGLKIFDNCFVVDLLTDPPAGGGESRCLGAICYHQRYGLQMVWAKKTIIATGGAGVLWRETTNPQCATADGHAMAFRAGVRMVDMEMMQFHPTTLYIAGASRSLISEAVRGEGAYLVDREGNRFMDDYHEMAELAPRDIVSRAILSQMSKSSATNVYLDVRHIGLEKFSQRFPGITEQCMKFEINPGSDLIPVRPAAHYMIGGADVDLDGRTNIANLFACGECSSTGLHGANRLASNSLLEALVIGSRSGELAGTEAASQGASMELCNINYKFDSVRKTELDIFDIRNSLRAVMWRNVGVTRTAQPLEETVEISNFWGRYVLDKVFNDTNGWELQNMLTASRMTAEAALRRTESRGVHFREDFPNQDESWLSRMTMQLSENQLVVGFKTLDS